MYKRPICPKCKTKMEQRVNKETKKIYYYCPKKCDIFITAHPDGSPVGTPEGMNIDKEFDERDFILEFYPRTIIQKENPAMEIKEIDTGTLTKNGKDKIKQFYNHKISKLLGDIIEVGICQRPQIIKLINKSEFKDLINK